MDGSGDPERYGDLAGSVTVTGPVEGRITTIQEGVFGGGGFIFLNVSGFPSHPESA